MTIGVSKLLARPLAGLIIAAGALFVVGHMSAASAATNQIKGVNWADTRDNYNTGWVIPDGLAADMSYSRVYSIANADVQAFKNNLGANTVRLPINPPSVSESWWDSYKATIDASLDNGMNVIICAWTEKNTVGTITDMTAWNSMWTKVVGAYGSNGKVYFQPLNEPFGYSASQWISVASGWLSKFSSVPRGRVIIGGTGYDDNVTAVGASSALSGTLLSQHYYATWNPSFTRESQWVADLNNRFGGYQSRTVVTEFGGPMTTGINYLANHDNGEYQSYFAAVTDTARSDSMGTVVWAGLKTGDNYSVEYHSGSTLKNNNSSAVTQLRWGWGY
ncbi:cellulase family glycosylhydrolase [Actinoplanes subtropicus]|uniref:cellulase family glycosylhydrolase n=1 Tax=Actinoplanes subtropicus TaxID=543632 RepID=UPI00068E915D|nr:cellulase family glycosylhydrolase [Actinoplanes subtropicus]